MKTSSNPNQQPNLWGYFVVQSRHHYCWWFRNPKEPHGMHQTRKKTWGISTSNYPQLVSFPNFWLPSTVVGMFIPLFIYKLLYIPGGAEFLKNHHDTVAVKPCIFNISSSCKAGRQAEPECSWQHPKSWRWMVQMILLFNQVIFRFHVGFRGVVP